MTVIRNLIKAHIFLAKKATKWSKPTNNIKEI